MFSEALAGLSMTVEVGGDTHDVTFKPGDLIRFERHFKKPITELTDAEGNISFGMDQLGFLAHAALTRTDRFDGDYEAFVDQLDDIELTGAVDTNGENPTQAAG